MPNLKIWHMHYDEFPDNYVSRPDVTVLGFGRENKGKFLTRVHRFSIGFVESREYLVVEEAVKKVLE